MLININKFYQVNKLRMFIHEIILSITLNNNLMIILTL